MELSFTNEELAILVDMIKSKLHECKNEEIYQKIFSILEKITSKILGE